MSSSYRRSLDEWLADLEVSADRVIDIGGAQLPVKGRTKSWDVGEYLIGDLDTPHAGSSQPDFEVDLNHDKLPAYKADLIFCLEVFEYIYDPMNALSLLNAYMREGGRAWVSFPSFYPHHQPIEDDSLRYMESGIKKLANAVGLTIMNTIKRRPQTSILEAAWRAEGMRAAKGYDHNVTGFIVEFKQ